MTNMLSDFDVSCLVGTSEAALQARVGTEDFWSPLWQAGKRYRAVEDLASLVLSSAWLLNMRTESPVECVRWVAKLPNAPESMIKTADDVLRMFQEELEVCKLELDADVDLVAVARFVH